MKNVTRINLSFIALFSCSLLLVSSGAFAQKKLPSTLSDIQLKMADKKYAAFAYPEAIEMYKKVNGVDTSTHIIHRIADSYLKIDSTKRAEEWFAKLGTIRALDKDEQYHYAQALAGNGKYDEANEAMQKFINLAGKSDKRAIKFNALPVADLKKLRNREGDFTITNLSVNSPDSDFGASFVNDSTLVFASSRANQSIIKNNYSWTEDTYLDLYVFKKKKTGTFNDPQLFSNQINTRFHEGATAFSGDGKTIYFTRNNFEKWRAKKGANGSYNLKIYTATLGENGVWENITPLPFNSDDFSTGHPALSKDGNTLYFTSDRPGGYGKTDIYRVQKKGDQWGEVENLGKAVNTEADEFFPFLQNDNKLFFASEGHPGVGGLDIFSTDLVANEFDKVSNIGIPINSSSDDFGFIINSNGMDGYFSSNRDGGKGSDDIYSFITTEPLKAKEKVPVYVQVMDDYGNPIKNTDVDIYHNQNFLQRVKTNEKGVFKFRALPLETYTFEVQDEEFEDVLLDLFVEKEVMSDNPLVVYKPIDDKTKLAPKVVSVQLNDSEGNPIKNTDVEIFNGDNLVEKVKTNDKGEFQYKALPLETYTLKVDHEDFIDEPLLLFIDNSLDESTPIVLTKDKQFYVPAELPPADTIKKSIAVQVLGDNGTPSTQTNVSIYNGDQLVQVVQTDEKGIFNFKSLPNETYTFKVDDEDFDDQLLVIYITDESKKNNKPLVYNKRNPLNLSLTGKVTDSKTKKPIDGVTVTITDKTLERTFNITSDVDGNFEQALRKYKVGDQALLEINLEKKGYLTKNTALTLNIEQLNSINLNTLLNDFLQMDFVQLGDDIGTLPMINPIYFDFDQSYIRRDAANELNKIVKIMKENKSIAIELSSHTDSRGSAIYNTYLANLRAKSSASYLISNGIQKSRVVSAKGYGESQLVNRCKDNVKCSEEEHQSNRRTEFKIVKF